MLAMLLLGQLAAKPLSFEFTDVGGGKLAIPVAGAKATVLVFVGVDCPIANRMAPEIARIAKDYSPRGVASVLVYPDASLKPAQVAAHLKSFAMPVSAVIDGSLKLVKATHASVPPQAVILDASGVVRYIGRINDLYEEHGKIKPKPKRNDLRVSLDEFLAGKPISKPMTPVIGCFITGA